MQSLQIQWTVKTGAPDSHDSIRLIGGRKREGASWELPVEDAIRVIANKQYTFYVMADGRRTDVFIAKTPEGQKYLRCRADDLAPDTLGRLPDST